ncbi:MAG TPA: universal stress protein [Thermomicrobiales bacterium]|nr:universal stress protein [Thermomicrobiales bacterium]
MTGRLAPYMTRLLIAVHDHNDIEIGVEWGRALASALHLPITFAAVVDRPQENASVEQLALMARDTLGIVASDPRLRGLDVSIDVVTGDPAERLPELAGREEGTLLILALEREEGSERSLAEGSRLRKILRNLRSAYMLLPVEARVQPRVHSIVVGYDRSAHSSEVLRVARVMAGSLDVNVIAVEAIEPESASPEEFQRSELVLDERLIRARGFASRTLLAVARARDAAAIVVGSHGLGTSPQLLMGRTTEWLANYSDRPVLVVPQPR